MTAATFCFTVVAMANAFARALENLVATTGGTTGGSVTLGRITGGVAVCTGAGGVPFNSATRWWNAA